MILSSWTKQVDEINQFRLIHLREITEAIDASDLVRAGHNLMLFDSPHLTLIPIPPDRVIYSDCPS
jgi:hypothetical protein